MLIRNVQYEKTFERRLKKYTKRLPQKELRALKGRLSLFQKDPFHMRLNTHKLKGDFLGYWSFSISYSDRIIFRFIGDKTVFFVDIGDHSIYE